MTGPAGSPLWTCPTCGRRFVGRNMWHACGEYSVEGFLAGKGPRARALFRAFVDMIASLGPYETAPAKTRVAFMVRVRFASVNGLTERAMTIHFGLPRRLDHPRIAKVEQLGSWHLHHLRITSVDQLDEELRGWLAESRREMGEQRRLVERSHDPRPRVRENP